MAKTATSSAVIEWWNPRVLGAAAADGLPGDSPTPPEHISPSEVSSAAAPSHDAGLGRSALPASAINADEAHASSASRPFTPSAAAPMRPLPLRQRLSLRGIPVPPAVPAAQGPVGSLSQPAVAPDAPQSQPEHALPQQLLAETEQHRVLFEHAHRSGAADAAAPPHQLAPLPPQLAIEHGSIILPVNNNEGQSGPSPTPAPVPANEPRAGERARVAARPRVSDAGDVASASPARDQLPGPQPGPPAPDASALARVPSGPPQPSPVAARPGPGARPRPSTPLPGVARTGLGVRPASAGTGEAPLGDLRMGNPKAAVTAIPREDRVALALKRGIHYEFKPSTKQFRTSAPTGDPGPIQEEAAAPMQTSISSGPSSKFQHTPVVGPSASTNISNGSHEQSFGPSIFEHPISYGPSSFNASQKPARAAEGHLMHSTCTGVAVGLDRCAICPPIIHRLPSPITPCPLGPCTPSSSSLSPAPVHPAPAINYPYDNMASIHVNAGESGMNVTQPGQQTVELFKTHPLHGSAGDGIHMGNWGGPAAMGEAADTASEGTSGHPDKLFPLLAANITKYGDQFLDFLKCTSYKALLVTETHLPAGKIPAAILALRAMGWRAVFAPAVRTGRSEAGTAGGALALIRSNYATAECDPDEATGEDWAMVSILFKGMQVDCYSLYLTDGIGFSGANVHKLSQLATAVRARAKPFMIFGDWNMTPGQLLETNWPQAIKANLVAPKGAGFTCRVGCRMLDFGAVSRDVEAAMTGCFSEEEVPWGPHTAVGILFHRNPRSIQMRTVIAPPSIDTSVVRANLKSGILVPEWKSIPRQQVPLEPVGDEFQSFAASVPLFQGMLGPMRMLGSKFASWGRAAEDWLLKLSGAERARDTTPSRGQLPLVEVVPAVAPRGFGASYSASEAQATAVLDGRLADYQKGKRP